MAAYEVVPHRGVGPVRLGMTRAESRAAMGAAPRRSRRLRGGAEVDVYHGSAFRVDFDADDRVVFVELSRVEPPVVALYKGADVFALTADEAVAPVGRDAPFDPGHPEPGYTYVFPALELALWRPVVEEPEGRHFSTIAVGVPGYFSGRVSE